MATKRTRPRAKSAKHRIAEALASLDAVGDADTWCDEFLVAVQERLQELDGAEECVVFYVGIELVEREVHNGGFAQAFLRYGPDSADGTASVIKWALGGYRMFGRPKAEAILKRAGAVAKKDSKKLRAINALGGEAGIEAYLAYRTLGTFAALEREAAKGMATTGKQRIAIVRKYRAEFAELAVGD